MKASNQGTVNLSQSASGGGGSGTGSGGNSATRQQARGQDICSTVDVRALRVCVYARVGVSECAVWLKRSGTLIPHGWAGDGQPNGKRKIAKANQSANGIGIPTVAKPKGHTAKHETKGGFFRFT